jgi:hypothetical protein
VARLLGWHNDGVLTGNPNGAAPQGLRGITPYGMPVKGRQDIIGSLVTEFVDSPGLLFEVGSGYSCLLLISS